MSNLYISDTLQPACAPTVIALGCFDGIHPGHRAVLQTALAGAAAYSCIPSVFTFGTREVMLPPTKQAKELMSTPMKLRILSEMGFQHITIAPFEQFRNFSPEAFVTHVLFETLRAKMVCCGFNYRFGKNGVGNADMLRTLGEKLGIVVKISPPVEWEGAPISSTRIRAAIQAGDMLSARQLLGQPFSIDFPVVHGRKLGRTIGTPTINQEFPDSFLLPRFGVYASRVVINHICYSGVTNAGIKPTVGAERPLAETYISGYQGDLYGQNILVQFLQFLRPECRFESVKALQAQIQKDAQQAEQIASNYSD